MMAGVELDRCASGNEMSNQQSVKARYSSTKTWIALGKLVATYNFAASPFLHYMISISGFATKTIPQGGPLVTDHSKHYD